MNEEPLETASRQIPPYIVPLLSKTTGGDVKYNAVYPTPFISLGYPLRDHKGNWTLADCPSATPSATRPYLGWLLYIIAFISLLAVMLITEPYLQYRRWQERRQDERTDTSKWWIL